MTDYLVVKFTIPSCILMENLALTLRSFLQIWSHLLKKSLMENLIFYAV